jgi:cytochrome b
MSHSYQNLIPVVATAVSKMTEALQHSPVGAVMVVALAAIALNGWVVHKVTK